MNFVWDQCVWYIWQSLLLAFKLQCFTSDNMTDNILHLYDAVMSLVNVSGIQNTLHPQNIRLQTLSEASDCLLNSGI